MGAFLIMDINFKTKKDRQKFEKEYKIKPKQILVDEYSDSGGFAAWTVLRNPLLDVVYYMGFMGYGEPAEILKECKEKKIGIKFMAWMPVNDRNSAWIKVRGKW